MYENLVIIQEYGQVLRLDFKISGIRVKVRVSVGTRELVLSPAPGLFPLPQVCLVGRPTYNPTLGNPEHPVMASGREASWEGVNGWMIR